MKAAILSVLALALAACSGVRSIHPKGEVVQIRQSRGLASAAVIGPTTLLTVAHAVDRHGEIRALGKTARVTGVIRGNPEDLVVLEVDSADYESSFVLGGSAPVVAHTLRRSFLVKDWTPIPGDSGSPVVDREGRLVGLVWGYDSQKRLVVARPVLDERRLAQ